MSGSDRRAVALSIKTCLDRLQMDAEHAEMDDLARFIGLASLAAEEAILDEEGASQLASAFMMGNPGHC